MPAVVVRTRLMVQGASTGSEATKYRGFLHACKTMLRNEGIGAFYKGALLNAAFTPPARGMFILGMEGSRKAVGEGTALRDFAAGTAGQLVSSLAYVPRDVIVERCAIDGQLSKQVGSSASSVQVLTTIIRTEGLAGFYRAYMPHQYVWIPFNGLMLSFLGKGKEVGAAMGLSTNSVGFGVLNTLLSASTAALLTTPIDVVKTRLQVSGANPELFNYSGPLDCATKVVRAEGAVDYLLVQAAVCFTLVRRWHSSSQFMKPSSEPWDEAAAAAVQSIVNMNMKW
eukprot:CAMPEP_0115832778 /NCGR_PEP_ID=MMETSP0287-20121206/2834_1 /TAXON_ID=412157 /ORGANISM="Chrysochromulina rotalis, Strain UIO044" /LENGTH=282 /DNA_ID=CAMNT_0003286175 /DNA_START=51 /DNA_END=897 /DNA_ORIENTATION=+